jgi:serine protease DegQ
MRLCISGLMAILLGVPAFADEKPKPVSVPYKLTGTNHVMVRVKINGKGPFNFIVDTGAPALFVATKIAKKVGVEKEKDGFGTFDSFELEGGLKIDKARGAIEDPFQLEGMNGMGLAGYELHGMIGFNLLAKYKIQYDFTSDKLVLTELPGFEPGLPPRLGGGGQGGMEFIGVMMKFLGPLMGFNGVPERKPRGFLGVELTETDSSVTIKSVLPGSPADKAGLKAGDTIKNMNKDKIDLISDVAKWSAKRPAGAEITINIIRDGSEKKITVELGKGL